MGSLAKRERFLPKEMIWIVKTASNMGTDNANLAAANLIEKIFDKANNDQNFENDKDFKKAAAGLHALGLRLDVQIGKYEKAREHIDAVKKDHPHSLETRVSEATILTEWAGREPDKYDAAIAAWDTLRNMLERRSANPDPKKTNVNGIDPKYDVILQEADCYLPARRRPKTKMTPRRRPGRAWTCCCPI